MLVACREVFEREEIYRGLGAVFSAFADFRHKIGQKHQAISFEEMAIRYEYISFDPKTYLVAT